MLCHSLSGLEIPMLTVTSRALLASSEFISEKEFKDEDPDERLP